MKNRQKANMEILDILNRLFTELPDIRFGQGLAYLDVHNDIGDFYLESEELLAKIKKFNNLKGKE